MQIKKDKSKTKRGGGKVRREVEEQREKRRKNKEKHSEGKHGKHSKADKKKKGKSNGGFADDGFSD